jgi:dephospho-CoA kinase
MITLAVTGGIGSGKTTVVNFFKDLGCPVFIADYQAKELMQNSVDLKNEIVKEFGDCAYKNGSLNTDYLAKQVFNDVEALQKLNNLVHPAVAKAYEKWKNEQTQALLIYEAAIIFEKNKQSNFDYTLLVTAPKTTKLKRIKERDQKTYSQIEARMKNQWSDNRKKKLADFVINNEELIKTEQNVHNIYKYLKNTHNF